MQQAVNVGCSNRADLGDWRALHRIEQREQQQSGQKAADMGLPCDGLILAGHERHRAKPEQQIEPEPDAEERQTPADCAAQQRAARPEPGRRCRDRACHMSSEPPGSNAKRAAAPIMPEMPADAPIIGASAPACATR